VSISNTNMDLGQVMDCVSFAYIQWNFDMDWKLSLDLSKFMWHVKASISLPDR